MSLSAETTIGKPSRARAPKLRSSDRREMILRQALDYFAANGFTASTRDLATAMGITQSLLYRYFPNKQALIEAVYDEVTLSRWNPFWEDIIKDRSKALEVRLEEYYLDYAKLVLRHEWVRILIFAGFEKSGINDRLFKLLKERIFEPVVRECIAEYCSDAEALVISENLDLELELVWSLHASIFYIGMRKWVYATTMPKDVNATIIALVSSFLCGMKARLRARSASLAKPSARRRGKEVK
jgi:AcrR family transcriptional regulator